jgi:histone H1/5
LLSLANVKTRNNMSDAPAKPAAKKAPAKKKPAEHPKYTEMITAAITALKNRKGSSKMAITKFITANYKVGDNADSHVKLALKRGVASELFLQVKGVGASGSFKNGKAPKVAKPKKAPAAKKTVKKTPKKAAPKAVVKKVSAKKATKKPAKKPAKKAKSPKKAKKPAAKKPAAKKTPKKAAKKPAKKPAKK